MTNSDIAMPASRGIIRNGKGKIGMPNERSSEGGHIKARVRSADSAVIKAVEHETAASRKTVHRIENEKTKGGKKHPKARHVKNPSEKHISRAKERKLYGVKKRKKFLVPLLIFLFLELVLGALVYGASYIYDRDTATIVSEHTIEAGSSADLGMYITGEPMFGDYVSCNLDFSTVNYTLPQTIRFTVRMYGTNFPCTLTIVDTTAPVAEGIPQTMFSIDEVPPVEDCITNIYDLNDVTVEWAEVPDITKGGELIAKAAVTDSSGNVTIVDVPFSVTRDVKAPVIEGTEDIEAFIGDSIAYRENVTVEDDIDPNPVLEIDTSGVIADEEGTYEVIYRAKDFTGNISETAISLTLTEKPDTWVEPELVYEEAEEILNSITWDTMTDMEVALQITYWVRYNVYYTPICDDTNWTRAAYDGFTKRSGNCYSIAMCAKALFDVAGIENMIIIREPYYNNPHFWNYIKIDDQWYHCDSTPRIGYDSYFFMYTTDELHNIWLNGWNGYSFDEELYPESATDSVQYRINYYEHSIYELDE